MKESEAGSRVPQQSNAHEREKNSNLSGLTPLHPKKPQHWGELTFMAFTDGESSA